MIIFNQIWPISVLLACWKKETIWQNMKRGLKKVSPLWMNECNENLARLLQTKVRSIFILHLSKPERVFGLLVWCNGLEIWEFFFNSQLVFTFWKSADFYTQLITKICSKMEGIDLFVKILSQGRWKEEERGKDRNLNLFALDNGKNYLIKQPSNIIDLIQIIRYVKLLKIL